MDIEQAFEQSFREVLKKMVSFEKLKAARNAANNLIEDWIKNPNSRPSERVNWGDIGVASVSNVTEIFDDGRVEEYILLRIGEADPSAEEFKKAIALNLTLKKIENVRIETEW